MTKQWAATAGAVLRALADLAPSAEQAAAGLTVPTEWFSWLPARTTSLFVRPLGSQEVPPSDFGPKIDRNLGERLASLDQVRAGARSLRAGWLFVAGRVDLPDGRTRRVFHPLVTVPVRVDRQPLLGAALLHAAGDVELTELIADRALRGNLEARVEIGGGGLAGTDEPAIPQRLLDRLPRLAAFAKEAAAAAGLPATEVVVADRSPDGFLRQHTDKLVIVAGVAVYAVHETGGMGRGASLRTLADQAVGKWSAFHSLYIDQPLPDDDGESEVEPDQPVESPYVLTPVQRTAVQRSRHEAVTLISGAPGTGKSHTVAAIACDALARGQSVLLAAKSDATVDALLDLLERAPGPEPVVFGSSERREALATRLAAGQIEPLSAINVTVAADRRQEAIDRRESLRRAMLDRLAAEALLSGHPQDDSAAATARAVAPDLFDPAVDLAEAERLLVAAAAPTTDWWSRRKRRKQHRALRALTGALPDATVEEIEVALAAARATRSAGDLVAAGGLELGDQWDELLRLDDAAREGTARWLAAESRSSRRLNRATLGQIAVLATALRSGRAARRTQLRQLDHAKLTRGLPLWAGTLPDVDDLLPPVPALFDLVILDEASSIDQPLAAAALIRGARAVIVGDPRQLRHVSFVSDERSRTVVEAHGLGHLPQLAARLDVRRNSVFDVAAGVAPVLTLDEHFRSAPHLVEFVTRRLYDGLVTVATRSPATESKDCVEVVWQAADRDKAGVVDAEVAWVVQMLRDLRDRGARSVGVVTPFRAQADAIEAAVLGGGSAGFSADDLERLDLRIGTVHAFQGNERDVVLASVGVGASDAAGSWRFVQDPHLFAVFVTRARKRLTFVVSGDPPESGLVADYLAQVDAPPGRPAPVDGVSAWAGEIARELVRSGLPATTGYPTGRHVLDICVGDASRSIAIECDVHRDGPEAHVERHLALRRGGWEILEAHRSKWADRPAELVVELVNALRRMPSSANDLSDGSGH